MEVPEKFQGVEVPENYPLSSLPGNRRLSFFGFLPKRLRQCFEVPVI